jgi:hypothetical protein
MIEGIYRAYTFLEFTRTKVINKGANKNQKNASTTIGS